jgi:hypothetical protein
VNCRLRKMPCHHAAMTQTTERPAPRPTLAGKLIFSVLGFSMAGWVAGILSGDGIAESVAGGAFAGLLPGGWWYAEARRAQRYRASFDPKDRFVRWPERGRATSPFTNRRYRYPVALRLMAAVGGLMWPAIAMASSVAPEAGVGVAVVFWVIAAVAGVFAWHVFFTSTEVRADGLVVRTTIRRQTISWSELFEVRWQREAGRDVLVFCAVDGRAIKSAGVAVTAEGYGERRMLRLLDDIESAWATDSTMHQRRGLLTRLANSIESRSSAQL